MTTLRLFLADPRAAATLQARAQLLAQPSATAAAEIGEPTLRFMLGADQFSIPAAAAQSVQPLSRYTALPAMPPWLIGLVNVRGRLLAAVDLRPLLSIAPTPPRPGSLLVIVRGEDAEIGILADAVLGVDQRSSRIAPQPANAPGLAAPWIEGVDETLCIQCDPAQLIASMCHLASEIEIPKASR